jgi:hypothetical protein
MGLQRKAHRICISKSEELERKARFLALRAKNAPIPVWKKFLSSLLNKIPVFDRVAEPPGNVFRALAGFQNNGSITRFREPIIFLERISIYGRNVKDEEYRHQCPY